MNFRRALGPEASGREIALLIVGAILIGGCTGYVIDLFNLSHQVLG